MFGLRLKNVQQDTAAATDARMGPYITKHDIPTNGNRRERVTNRVLTVVAGIFCLLCVIEAITVSELLPLYKVVPVFVTFSDKADQVVRIEPPSGRLASIDILTEQLVRDYITQRNTITADASETIDRWGTKIRLMSSEEVYSTFLSETQPVYSQIRAGNFTRQVAIKSILKMQPGLYQVEFDTFDHHQGSGLSDTTDRTETWIAQMRIVFRPSRVTYQNRFVNPLGFTVVEYSVAPKKS